MSYGIPAGPPAQEVPVCPRHPDRISYIRCQRCGRPACPECQHSAPVGIQCVDCFHESRRNVPGYRTSYGGTVRAGKPVVTTTLMILCAVVYALQWLVPGVTEMFLFAPVLATAEPWRLLTAAFLHSPGFIFHIAFNLYALWLLGRSLEPLLGGVRFILLYLISALGGSIGVLLLAPAFQAVVGASGAIFGLFGAMFVIQRQRGGDIKGLLILIGINLVLGFVYPSISWQAHLGGLLTGAACAAVLAYAPKGPRRSLVQFGGLAAITAVLLAVAFLWTPAF